MSTTIFDLITLSLNTVPSLQGTANMVLVNGTSGSPVTGSAITLTLPQFIGSTSTPTFGALTLDGAAAGLNLKNTTISSGSIGPINWEGNDASAGLVIYGRARNEIVSNTAGATTSKTIFSVQNGSGSLTDYVNLDGSTETINLLKTINASSLTASQLVVTDSSKNLISGNLSGDVSSSGLVTTIGTAKVTNSMLAGSIDLTTKVTGILPAGNGGSGNAFFQISGPASSVKTYTLPNSSAQILTNNAPVSLNQGGTNAALSASASLGGIVYSTASAMAILAGTATAGRMLQSGASAAPSWSTPTYPSASGSAGLILRSDGTNNVYSTSTFADTYTASNLLYSNGANTVTGLATANNGTLITSGTGVPSISSTLPNAVQDNITRLGTLAVAVKNTAQPAFFAEVNTTITDVTGDNTTYTIIFGNEVFDQANEYNPATGTFTASQTGKYQFNLTIILSGLTASHTVGYARLVTPSRQYVIFISNLANCRDANSNYAISASFFVSLTSGNTVTANVTVANGTKVVDIAGTGTDTNSNFSGFLVC